MKIEDFKLTMMMNVDESPESDTKIWESWLNFWMAEMQRRKRDVIR